MNKKAIENAKNNILEINATALIVIQLWSTLWSSMDRSK